MSAMDANDQNYQADIMSCPPQQPHQSSRHHLAAQVPHQATQPEQDVQLPQAQRSPQDAQSRQVSRSSPRNPPASLQLFKRGHDHEPYWIRRKWTWLKRLYTGRRLLPGSGGHHRPRAQSAAGRNGRRHPPWLVTALPRSVLAIAAVGITAVCLLAACSTTPPRSRSLPTPQPSGTRRVPPRAGSAWLLTRSALAQLIADPAVRDELADSRVYEILQPGQRPLAGVTAEPVVTFASAAQLADAVNNGQIPAGTYGVLYDPEAWTFTPAAEQRDPVHAATAAAAAAHAHGLRLIVAPALNL